MLSSTYCVYPFTNLNSNTEGSVKLCCSINENLHATADGEELNFGKHSIEDIWNSDYMQTVRKQMLNGERPEACRVCWDLEDKGVQSSRQSAFSEPGLAYARGKEYRSIEPPLPQSLELRLGNFCNLRCNSCWSLSSDRIADERTRMVDKVPEWLSKDWQYELDLNKKANWRWWEDPEFDATIAQLAPNLKRLYLTGGEPTLIKRNTEIMRQILDSGNKDCYIALTTNLTNWDDDFFNTMAEFNNGELQISVDHVREQNEYIRFPTKWSKVEENLAKITVTFPVHWTIKHYTVYQAYNFDAVNLLLDWLHWYRSGFDYDHDRIYIWSPIILDYPKYLNINMLPQVARREYTTWLKKEYRPPMQIKNLWYQHGIDQIVNLYNHDTVFEIDVEEQQRLQKQFVEYNDALDKQRKTNWRTTFPSVAKWISPDG